MKKFNWRFQNFGKYWTKFNGQSINSDLYFPSYSLAIFLVAFLILFIIYDFQTISFLPPQSVHQWRQCDCLSFSLNYFQDNNSFWQAQINYLGNDGTGKTVSDFPILYYIVAQIWKITGQKEFIYRFLILSISLLGLIAQSKLIEKILKNSFWAILISLFLFSSTIFVYYSNNFLMNVPAFSLALIALNYFYDYLQNHKLINLISSIFLFLFAGLLKIQALTSFVAIFILLIAIQIKLLKSEKSFIKHPVLASILFLSIIAVIISWYTYAHYYNEQHNKGLFLIGILPIWEYNKEQILHVFTNAWILWSDSYQSRFLQAIAILFLIFTLIYRKYLPVFFRYFVFLLFMGFATYIILWFQVFDNHDYYMINQLIFMQSLFVAGLYILKQRFIKIYNSSIFKLLAILLLIYNINTCRKNIHTRYYGWPNEKHVKFNQAFENIQPYLNEIEVNKNDTVIILNDYSLNISLYLMNRKGYTDCMNLLEDSASIAEKIKLGARYLFLNDSSLLTKDYLKPFLHQEIGKYKTVHIFKLQSP